MAFDVVLAIPLGWDPESIRGDCAECFIDHDVGVIPLPDQTVRARTPALSGRSSARGRMMWDGPYRRRRVTTKSCGTYTHVMCDLDNHPHAYR